MLKNVLSATAFAGVASLAMAEPNPLRDAYFGETHLHTAFSLDAYIGGTRLMPADSLAYAKGEPVTLPDGTTAQHRRPLDFAAVTDHAEYLGEMYSTMFEAAPGHDNEDLVALRGLESLEDRQQWFIKYVVSSNRSATPQHPPFFAGPETSKSAWQVIVEAAEEANDPGTFTALIGFEWSAAPNGANLHRNVLFRDNNVPASVPSYIDINEEENLWAWMKGQDAEGRRLLAIPHNSNASKGRMFPDTDSFGEAMDLEYARTRQAYEPLIEMMQVKGNSEVHRKFWAADEFAGFENADSIQKNSGRIFRQRDFVRGGLIDGLGYEFALGVNPFKYGFIGGTDNHNGMMSAVAEDSFIGAHGPEDGSVERRRTGSVAGWIDGQDLSIGALAGVWATENTRAGIWDAMKRRETFATSGPRIKIRMFSGVGLSAPSDPVAMAREGYLLGTHMGGNLPPLGEAPTFTVYAEKDPMGANLDRIQIIKGWVDEYGDANEKIIDVVWAGERVLDPATGKLPPVGNTVNLETAMFTNDIGAPILMGSWTDKDYNPQAMAFYYARAIEIPTPRWTTYDAVRNDLPLLEDVPAVIQERAWGSPIFYSPAN
ncbi:DUF3604 domain-containing protein [Aliiruegeria sabulilitoris]|uniref:DUF3604 domain-containing protein n=1 Tax=Aliiruegeria sabulilitoris TaxID=1510458 RepID=UPI0008372E32|nr:DUF3604 domain-containing protein [Aliiruegeria sabulilitoris]NDR56165.1 DUF3604 domain-containing protein [Pseudoruegeria sp. M32A2M]